VEPLAPLQEARFDLKRTFVQPALGEFLEAFDLLQTFPDVLLSVPKTCMGRGQDVPPHLGLVVLWFRTSGDLPQLQSSSFAANARLLEDVLEETWRDGAVQLFNLFQARFPKGCIKDAFNLVCIPPFYVNGRSALVAVTAPSVVATVEASAPPIVTSAVLTATSVSRRVAT